MSKAQVPGGAPAVDSRTRAFNRERFKEEASAAIGALMEREGVTRAQLAARLGRSRPFVSKILDSQHNFTLETLADVALSLGYALHFYLTRDAMRLALPEIRVDDDAQEELRPYSFEDYTSVLEIDMGSGEAPAPRTGSSSSESAPIRITA